MMLDRRSAFLRHSHRVHRINAVLANVNGHTHAALPCCIGDRVKDVWPKSRLTDNLDAIHSEGVPFIDDLPCTFRAQITRIVPATPERIDVHARRDNLIRRDLLLLCHHSLGIFMAHIKCSNRRHTVSQKQFVDVFGGNIFALVDVDMHVN